jgi:hypothetical protein
MATAGGKVAVLVKDRLWRTVTGSGLMSLPLRALRNATITVHVIASRPRVIVGSRAVS